MRPGIFWSPWIGTVGTPSTTVWIAAFWRNSAGPGALMARRSPAPLAQIDFFNPPPPPVPEQPSAIIASVSGGLDSAAVALWARQRWPNAPIILWHAELAGMDWPQTDAVLGDLAARLGNCQRVTVQGVYRLTGDRTPGDYFATTLSRLHTVRDGERWFGAAPTDDVRDITTLRDFVQRARRNQPPTSAIRYCTSYFKSAVCDRWLNLQRSLLGDQPLLLTGERWAESTARTRLARTRWRFDRQTADVVWHRPIIDQPLHTVAQMVRAAGLPLHPCYAWQGES